MSNARSIYFSQFFHRKNADATIDSICGLCFQTIASSMKEDELRAPEVSHRCPSEKRDVIAQPHAHRSRSFGIRLYPGALDPAHFALESFRFLMKQRKPAKD